MVDIEKLIHKFWNQEWPLVEDKMSFLFPQFEHRYDKESSAVLYSLIRQFEPMNCLEVGAYVGGATHVIMKALQKNATPYLFIASEKDDILRKETEKNLLKECGIVPFLIGDITKNLHLIPDYIDFLFLDTNHDLSTTQWIFSNLIPRVKENSLVAIHDFPAEDREGEWILKPNPFPEAEYIVSLHKESQLPLEKLYWNYGEGGGKEASFWIKK